MLLEHFESNSVLHFDNFVCKCSQRLMVYELLESLFPTWQQYEHISL